MAQTKVCKNCGKEFQNRHAAKYCSSQCYLRSRWGHSAKCKQCGAPLTADQFTYCSEQCRKDYWNKNDYHLRKKFRNWEQRKAIIQSLGGRCSKCGNDDFRVLDIHHRDSSKKQIPKHRHYNWPRRLKDWKANMDNLELLCANCHRIHTWEQMGYGK